MYIYTYTACRTSQVSRHIAAYSYIIPAEHGVADGLQLTGAKTNDSFISMFLLNLQCGGAECRGSAPSVPFWIRPCYTSDTVTRKRQLTQYIKQCVYLVFTVRRYALHGLSYRNCVRPSVRLSVCHTRALCPHGSTYDHDFFTIW